MLRKKLTVLGSGCFLAMSVHSAMALANTDRSLLTISPSSVKNTTSKTRYIVQLRDNPAVTQHQSQTIPDRFDGALENAKYNPNSAASQAYRQSLLAKQSTVMANAGISEATYQFEHAFNGFAAELTQAQVNKLKSDQNVLNMWPDELRQMDTANTPAFLGLTAPGGLHDQVVLGEDVIVGIVDSGVWPENPSLSDDGYNPIAATRPDWSGACDTGTDPEFSCNNKLIGARYFNDSFTASGTILPGEFDSPRDADGHGTHVATTAAGNANTPAVIQGADVGTVTGMAPRARVAMYKVCWNGSTPGNSGCYTGDSVAAIDAAVADGVDVINFSISGSRTASIDPVHVAFFNAARGGVFASLSAGNSGPGAETVAHNVPWVTTVAASTYDGESALIGAELQVTDSESTETLFSIPGAITAPIPEGGFAGELAATIPANACGEGLDNPEDMVGKFAYIARGTCNFSEKVLNAQNAGATGVVMYSDSRSPIAMGGDGTGITIPGVMITNEDGLALLPTVLSEPVIAEMTTNAAATSSTEVGNVMAGFSSRGGNQASSDIIKPDITAPGVTILAGASGDVVDTGVEGESYQYLSGTSMSSPHIAGLAALMKEVHPDWTPAAIKSALMTTARQNVVKEDGSTPADPFDFGAGHVVPNDATNPGLVYDASFNDYFAYICGLGESAFVDANYFPGACGALAGAGFPSEASDLNIASIAIGELSASQTVRRYVTNVGGTEAYTATIEAPAGVDVELSVYNFDTGAFEVTDTMGFNAGGLGVYDLTFSQAEDAVLDTYSFGAITWNDGEHTVRSPIAIRPVVPPKIVAPERLNINATQSTSRVTVPVEIDYNGRFYTQAIGLDESSVFVDTVAQDEDGSFSFNEPGLGFFFVNVPEGTRIAKFAIREQDLPDPTVDLDLFVWACPSFSCSQVGSSESAGSNEFVTLVDPVPLANLGAQDIYVVFIMGYNLNGAESVDVPLHVWTVDESAPQLINVRASTRATQGRTQRVFVGLDGLVEGEEYVGGILYTDENGEENGLTLLEISTDNNPE